MQDNYKDVQIKPNIKIEKQFALSNMNDLHYHSSHYEIYLLLSGKQKYFIDSNFYNMHAGDIAVINKGALHKTQKNFGGNRILLTFNQEFLQKYFSETSLKVLLEFFNKRVIRLENHQLEKAQNLMEKIIHAQSISNEEVVFYNLLQLFILLTNANTLVKEDYKNDNAFSRLIEYIDKNYHQIECLEDVSNAIFISKYHICHLFKTNLDITFNNYLLKIKLKEAKKLLASTNKTITEITQLCNFTNSSYFCYVFRRNIGISPSQYRKLNKI